MKQIPYYLLLASLILLPFNALPLYALGSISSEGSTYTLLLLALYLAINIIFTGKLYYLDKRIFYLFVALLCFSLFVGLYNYGVISSSYYMGRYGVVRFLEQLFQLLFGIIITYAISFTIDSEYKLYKVIQFLAYVMLGYTLFGVFQFVAYNFGGIISSIHDFIGNIIFHNGIIDKMQGAGRIHSVSQEPSLLSMYMAVIGPFVLFYSLKTNRYYLIFLMLFVLFVSYSRIGYVIFLTIIILSVILSRFGHISFGKIFYSIPLVLLLFVIIVLSPAIDVFLSLFDTTQSGSNAARYAASVAAILLWLDNNIWLGIGLGQAGFQLPDYIPVWGFISGEIQDVANGDRWPFMHNLLVKMLVENGIIGLVIWLSIFAVLLLKVNKIITLKKKMDDPNIWIGQAIFISLICGFLIMFNRELISNMNIWVCLGLATSYLRINHRLLK